MISPARGRFGSAANLRVALVCLALVAGMGGLAYASVPLYRIFCQVTGYGGETQRALNSEGIPVLDRKIAVRFDANVASDLDWRFAPVEREVSIRLGEIATIRYVAENLSDETITGSATFNVTPQSMGVYFNKLECFCFTETTLKPGERLEMPVVFFVDPEMVEEKEVRNIATVTLSYTFYPVRDGGKPVAETSSGLRDSAKGG